jgi:acyl-CoA synthetase (AMP-forming)/AMP-acid ligase II
VPDDIASLPTNLREALRRAALDFPHRGIAIFDGRGRSCERRSYAELYRLASESAARFAGLGIGRDEPVLVALPTSWEWMEAWFGLLMRGAWPVASSGAGAMAAAEAQFDKVDKVMAAIGARHVVASESFRAQAGEQGFGFAVEGVITIERLRGALPAPTGSAAGVSDGGDVAFLQLTSGSTGLPRAVMITHQGAIHNPVASDEAIGAPFGEPMHRLAECMVSWLPLYHDMGLIGCLMLPMLCGLDSWLLRPEAFLARPRLWLEQLGSHGTSFAPAPNFGYQLCLERIPPEKREGLDLTSWRAALTGAEMVRPETTGAFCAAFEPHGFRPESLRPCYGLAEGTLAVTFDVKGSGVRTLPAPAGTDAGFAMTDVVSNGGPIRNTSLRMTAPDGSVLPEGAIGEVCIKGPGVFRGYYRDPEATAATLKNGWFSTGDLGFLQGGELYLTGRTKDLLIVHGHNIMPDEIERLADSVTGGGGLMRSAAFSVARGAAGEQAVVVVETAEADPARLAEIGREIRVRIGRSMGLPLADLVFVRRGRIPRTTSGKMQRSELRQRYLDGDLERLHEVPAQEGAGRDPAKERTR